MSLEINIEPFAKQLDISLDVIATIKSHEDYLKIMNELNDSILQIHRYYSMAFGKTEAIEQWGSAKDKEEVVEKKSEIFDKPIKDYVYANKFKAWDVHEMYRINYPLANNTKWHEVYSVTHLNNWKNYEMQICPKCNKHFTRVSNVEKNGWCIVCTSSYSDKYYADKKVLNTKPINKEEPKIRFVPTSPSARRMYQSIW